MWININIPHHLILDNPARALAERLNELKSKDFILLSEIGADIDGIAWVEQGVSNG